MFQGFYDLASNMITQNRNLNIISNNMSNVSTPGYKMDRMMESTFRDEMLYRYDQDGKTEVGPVSRMNIADERVTDYTEGGIRETGYALDVGLTGNGFFVIETDNGEVYTRNGSFNLNNEGYLILPGMGGCWEQTDSRSRWTQMISPLTAWEGSLMLLTDVISVHWMWWILRITRNLPK